ncbi:DUF5381 family protein [Fredinandcohnia sp. 179-A 10B2 NHS]|uniref:DUF5381 family protein n=1 Tax=Fredinandcohnia sp. 179-A 10B2 NHS TaxID=3235176 RepID=UPI0039A3579D
MKKVNYRTSTILGRLVICAIFIVPSVSLILAGLFLDASAIRKIISIVAGLVGIVFCGRISIMLIILLLTNKKMFSYDNEEIFVKNKHINIEKIKKVDVENNIQTGYLEIRTPAYVLYSADGERIYIPTFYVVAKKDYPVILQTLKDIVSDKSKR